MIHLVLLVVCAQSPMPEIIVAPDGFVTVIEDPQDYAREQEHIEMIQEAYRAYNRYRKGVEQDLGEVIRKLEAVLNSGMELVPELRQRMSATLAELHHEAAKRATGLTPERLREIHENIGSGRINREDVEALDELSRSGEYQRRKQKAPTILPGPGKWRLKR